MRTQIGRRAALIIMVGAVGGSLVLVGRSAARADVQPPLIRIIVPSATGSSIDVSAPLLQPYLERSRLPTAAESGFPGFEGVQWFRFATGSAPKEIEQGLDHKVNLAPREAVLAEKLAQPNISVIGSRRSFASSSHPRSGIERMRL